MPLPLPLCSLYAWFDYDKLHEKHWAHHNNTGVHGRDPDFHGGDHRLLPWFVRFMLGYSTVTQFAKIFLFTSLLRATGVPHANLVLFVVAPPIVSAFRLFYFSTYLPHLPSNPQVGACVVLCSHALYCAVLS